VTHYRYSTDIETTPLTKNDTKLFVKTKNFGIHLESEQRRVNIS